MSAHQHSAASRLTPQQRLASSRRAIVQHMGCQNQLEPQSHGNGGNGAGEYRYGRAGGLGGAASDSFSAGQTDERPGAGLWRSLRRTVRAWWRSHPAHLAADIAHPLISTYAQAHPLKLMAVAAGLGAAVVVAKPWRLLSVTGMLIAALRSTPVLHLVRSFLSTHAAPSREQSH
jgi:hypothetical protein